jgi:hypothetical protein
LGFVLVTYQDHVYIPWTVHPDEIATNWKRASS